ncbi:type III secretion system chaperone [Pectobacterium polonicum]|uniref:Type III secretion system chaperone n=1 Tax=Pectobacterium polonicum TaxID=2485124 RepID=A0AAE9NMS1_9GAMM|nr:type III secretion system chaperone [Pectobacterium polonicum]TKY83810.1 DspFAvrF family protein [Pectobacterium polonicum]UVO06505.1 type III secretion system chaperone [Pectobacterium polonicum]GKW22422.1 type III chaperone ShcE [Pectobacterium carotovorum subsp. carotovorum]
MTPTQQHITRLLRHYGALSRTPLGLQNGICALCEPDGKEAVVLEVPASSSVLLLHSDVMQFQKDVGTSVYQLMLMLNFEMAAMKGCWLALDENSALRLCTQHIAASLDEPSFTALLPAFISQVKETRLLIRGLLPRLMAA